MSKEVGLIPPFETVNTSLSVMLIERLTNVISNLISLLLQSISLLYVLRCTQHCLGNADINILYCTIMYLALLCQCWYDLCYYARMANLDLRSVPLSQEQHWYVGLSVVLVSGTLVQCLILVPQCLGIYLDQHY